jgi:hypothetical protein
MNDSSYKTTRGRLSDISNADLYKILCENEEHDSGYLAMICSEVLRRQMADLEKSAEYKD